jgi:hypothetical protein
MLNNLDKEESICFEVHSTNNEYVKAIIKIKREREEGMPVKSCSCMVVFNNVI